MKRLAVALILLLPCAAPARADLAADFQEANTLYEQGDYPAAIDAYGALVDEGVENADLYYNLGNAYYKTNDLGRAVLYYERSLRRRPRNADTRDNLELVRSQLRDKQFVTKQNRIVRGIVWLHNNLSTGELVAYMSLSWLLLCVILLLIVLRDTAPVRTLYRRLSVASPGRLFGLTMTQDLVAAACVALILVGTAAGSAISKIRSEHDRRTAVVVTGEASVFSSPTDNATLQFKIHSGTMVSVSERREGWTRISLPGDLSGWVPAKAVESV